MASGEVEDYVDELNVIAGTVRRDLDLIGKLDEVRLSRQRFM